MEALKMEETDIRPTLDFLRNEGDRVKSEIESLRKRQEKIQEQDRELDRLFKANPQTTTKYKYLKNGETLPLAETLDELIDAGAQNAPVFAPTVVPSGKNKDSISNVIRISSQRCYQPSEQERLDWLASMESDTSSSTLSQENSLSEGDEKPSPQKVANPTKPPACIFGPDTGKKMQGLALPHGVTPPYRSWAPSKGSQNHPKVQMRVPPGFESRAVGAGLIELAKKAYPIPIAPPMGSVVAPGGPIPQLTHPGPSVEGPENKPLLNRLSDAFSQIGQTPLPRKTIKRDSNSAAQRQAWAKHVNLEYEIEDGSETPPQDDTNSQCPTEKEQGPLPSPESPPSSKEAQKPIFELPSTEFTIENPTSINFEPPRVNEEDIKSWRFPEDPNAEPEAPVVNIPTPPDTKKERKKLPEALIKLLQRGMASQDSENESQVGKITNSNRDPPMIKEYPPLLPGQDKYGPVPFPGVIFERKPMFTNTDSIATDFTIWKPVEIQVETKLSEAEQQRQKDMAAYKARVQAEIMAALEDFPKPISGDRSTSGTIDPPAEMEEEEEESEETEEEKATRRALKGKGTNPNSTWSLDFFQSDPIFFTPPEYPFVEGDEDEELTKSLLASLIVREVLMDYPSPVKLSIDEEPSSNEEPQEGDSSHIETLQTAAIIEEEPFHPPQEIDSKEEDPDPQPEL
ncbi:hypothetical protein ABW20_dc0100077 [Dactylellina cionopaga]|nr:hypothetical protein ABW20_dc0100077 [Dactylellina cionopaga]